MAVLFRSLDAHRATLSASNLHPCSNALGKQHPQLESRVFFEVLSRGQRLLFRHQREVLLRQVG